MGIPTVTVAVLATAVMVAVNYATNDTTTGPIAWAIVAAVTLASAAAAFWLSRRTQDATPAALAEPASSTSPPGPGANVQINGNTYLGPTAVQGSGEQHNHFGA